MARKRRGRGEGSIYQRKDGIWTTSISLGYDEKGKRKRRVVYGETKAEVQAKLDSLKRDTSNGQLCDPTRLTVGEYLLHWLENVHRPAVELTTYTRNEQKVRLHLIPHLGGIRLPKLTDLHIEQLYADMRKSGDSPQECQKCGKLLRTALKGAVKKRLIPGNPALLVPLPKVPRPEVRPYDEEQASAFLKAAGADRLYPLYVLAIDSGMRQGELFGLQWTDLDLETGSVFIQRSMEEVKGQLRLKELKTKGSKRRIQLATFTVNALREHRKQMLAAGYIASPVFCDTQGKPLRKSNVQRNSFKKIIKGAGLPDRRFHDLRHTCATILLLKGVNVKVVSERLGHSTIQQTLDTYSHILPTMQQAACEQMNSFFDPTHSPKVAAGAIGYN